MQITVVFSVLDWQEIELRLLEGEVIKKASVQYQYSGDFDGASEVEMLLLYKKDGTAVFSAIEKITGDYKGEPFSLLLTHQGQHEDNVARGTCCVQHSGGSLAKLTGAVGDYCADAAKVKLTLLSES